MPMIDAYLPQGALPPEAEAQLMRDLTDILIQHEGLDPRNPRVRDVTWIFVHRPAAVYRAGEPATAPIYRIVPSVPEGQYTDAARAGLVKEVTAAVARAEGVPADVIGKRVWVFPTEVNDGCWGARGAVRRLPDIMESFGGATLRELGERRLAAKRRVDAGRLIGALAGALAGGEDGGADHSENVKAS
ncbi:tautomerase family protein [Cupriavidus malaysiensis]|uniref:Tautomerase enzyme n=1 Tax=Cupriavidus malaysiensis TaxID=367825 RepID=A0ABN4TUE7_9BURK|nr:Tautomerase enzyme [Cupriavidus malaysiensis]AOZ10059.1 Tautomerase enzyme [Cupriavidus malaysiensis]